MNQQRSIRQRCYVNTNSDKDSFVGLKADTGDAQLYFPIGYQLPENDDDLRTEINNLLGVLSIFMKEERVLEFADQEIRNEVEFPLHAYLKIIRDYLRKTRYYIETDSHYRTDTKGNASWSRTVREQKALVQKNGSIVFTNITVRYITPNENKKITQIHRYCVYEAFEKMGWLYVPFMPDIPGPHPSIKESIYILNKKLISTHNDVEIELFSAMKDMLMYLDDNNSDKQFHFGTDYFEHVWGRMIDMAFGVKDKELYYPRSRWILDCGSEKTNSPLLPDTIMIYGDKHYVIDAKLYRYGTTAIPNHLPNSADIHKQITYGEYIEKTKKISNESLYNAFIMPFNKEDNHFKISRFIGNIGEANSDWKANLKNYERVQGIVIDTRYLMYNFLDASNELKREMAECIEKGLGRRNPFPREIQD